MLWIESRDFVNRGKSDIRLMHWHSVNDQLIASVYVSAYIHVYKFHSALKTESLICEALYKEPYGKNILKISLIQNFYLKSILTN